MSKPEPYYPASYHPEGRVVPILRTHQPQYCNHHITLDFDYLSDNHLELHSPYGGDPLDCLQLDAFISDGPDFNLIAWHLEYRDLYRTTLSDLRPKVWLLEMVERKLSAYDKTWGPARDYGQYALRVMKALSITHWTRPKGERHLEDEYTLFRIVDLPHHIDRMYYELREKDRVNA